MSLSTSFWSMAAMLRDSVVVVVRTRPRAIPLAMITMRKSTHGFPFLLHDEYGAPLGGPSGSRSSAIILSRQRALLFHHSICLSPHRSIVQAPCNPKIKNLNYFNILTSFLYRIEALSKWL